LRIVYRFAMMLRGPATGDSASGPSIADRFSRPLS
jgi:hypothetical protein